MSNNQGPEIIIGIMAKYPEEGMVKTRLVPPLTYSQATGLYEAILLDTIETVNRLDPYFQKVIFYYPENKRTYFNNITDSGWINRSQSGKDLGQRVENAFLGFKDHGSPVIIIGSDSPDLPGQYLTDSIILLQDNDVVLGPTEDGGFYLIAIRDISRSSINDIFRSIRWSTADALNDITGNLNIMKKNFALISKWYDVDTAQDIGKLISGFNKNNLGECKKTRYFISKYL